MSDPADHHDSRPRPRPPWSPGDDHATLLAVVLQANDGPDECTIYPAAVDPNRRTTTWISAKEGSFFALENCR